MAFTEREKEVVGWGLRTGEFAKLSETKQISIFVKGYGDNPDELVRLSKSPRMKDAHDKGMITFKLGKLEEEANKIRAKAKKIAQQLNQPTNIKDAATGQNLTTGQVYQHAGITINPASQAAIDEMLNTRSSLTGFNVNNFKGASSTEKLVPTSNANPVNRNHNGPFGSNIGQVTPQAQQNQQPAKLAYPAFNIPGYENMTRYERCSKVVEFANENAHNGVKPIRGNFGTEDPNQIMTMLAQNYEFIPGKESLGNVQMIGFGNFLDSAEFKSKLSSLGAKVQNLANVKLVETPISRYYTGNEYDYAFLIECQNRKNNILVLIDSAPTYDQNTGGWFNKNQIRLVTSEKKDKKIFRNIDKRDSAKRDLAKTPDLTSYDVSYISGQPVEYTEVTD